MQELYINGELKMKAEKIKIEMDRFKGIYDESSIEVVTGITRRLNYQIKDSKGNVIEENITPTKTLYDEINKLRNHVSGLEISLNKITKSESVPG